MSFFDKMKQSASEAAKKAQQTVEITKLRAQISGKEREMDRLFHQIGVAVYRAHQGGAGANAEEEITVLCVELDGAHTEIQMLEERIKNIRFEKTCGCGKVVPLDARFCPECGSQFPEEPKETTIGEIRVICSHCQTENELNVKFCLSCGNPLSSVDAQEPETYSAPGSDH